MFKITLKSNSHVLLLSCLLGAASNCVGLPKQKPDDGCMVYDAWSRDGHNCYANNKESLLARNLEMGLFNFMRNL